MDAAGIELTVEPFVVTPSTPAGERILEVAARLFYTRGIAATGVDLIALEAGVTKRTLYQRFGSKENLIAAYLTTRAARWQGEVLERVSGCPAPAALDALYDLAQHWSEAGHGCAFVNAWSEVGESLATVGDVVRAEKSWMRAVFDALAESSHAPDAGAVLHLLYEGAQVNAAIQRSAEPFQQARAASKSWLAEAARGLARA